MKLSGVYIILNRVTGDRYVGASHNIKKRWNMHRGSLNAGRHHSKPLQVAWRAYGADAFTFMMLECVAPERLRVAEQRYLDSGTYAYNVLKFATVSPLGTVHTGATRLKVCRTSKAWWATVDREALRAKMSAGISTEQRSESARLLWADPVYRERAIASRKGRAFNKGYRCTPEQIDNRRRAARLSNMKRNYGEQWRAEYARRYPQFAHEVAA